MPRASRSDDRGSLHHVMNRGIAHRSVFESRRDVRCFLAQIARAVRSGAIELHAFALMPTHFHLLVRSLRGELSKAIGLAVHRYVRWFNRSRERDGSLFRGRFRSKRVVDEHHERIVAIYIEDNPVAAGLAKRAVDYAWSSAGWSSRRPRWLAAPAHRYRRPSDREREAARWIVGKRLRATDRRERVDPWSELIGRAEPAVAAWMQRRAWVADGSRAGLPIATPDAVVAAIAHSSDRRCAPLGSAVRERLAPTAGLLRQLAGLEWRTIGQRLHVSASTAASAGQVHRQRMRADAAYAMWCSQVAVAATRSSTTLGASAAR